MSGTIKDAADKKVVAVRPAACEGDETVQHAILLQLEDGSDLDCDAAFALMDAGVVLHMVPPPGAPAHAAHIATGFPLMLQTRTCEHCGKRVLFA